jgi:hypothetical protein
MNAATAEVRSQKSGARIQKPNGCHSELVEESLSFHRCPVERCPRDVPNDQLLCNGHEQIVPVELLHELYFAWAEFQRTLHRRLDLKESVAAANRYHRARRDVIEAAGQL